VIDLQQINDLTAKTAGMFVNLFIRYIWSVLISESLSVLKSGLKTFLFNQAFTEN